MALVACVAESALAQDPPVPADTLRMTADWDAAQFQPRDTRLAFTVNRSPREADGRLVVVVGRSDLSTLLEVRDTRVLLPLRGEELPAGDVEVRAYLAQRGGDWIELGRYPLKLLNRAGFETFAMRPKLDVQSAQELDRRVPENALAGVEADRARDATANGGIEGGFRRQEWDVGIEGLVVGASRGQARLRASQLGPKAPAVDLASYNLRLTRSRLALKAGHLSIGNERQLVNQYRSRGLSAALTLPYGAQIDLAGVAGSEIVGWDDPLGIARPSHRVLTGSLGVEAVPARPGALRVELAAIDGARQPTPAFLQGAVTDREESRGLGAHVVAADPTGRLQLTAGAARSRFTNPFDPSLSGDSTIVAVRPETRTARFGELRLDALRGVKLAGAPTTLSVTARHERVDPQYRSIASTPQADRQENAIDATGMIDAVQLQFAHAWARDNLGGIVSLMTTRTQTQALNAAVPLAQLLRAPQVALLPLITMAWQTVWQAGDGLAPDGGFRDASQVPDQRTDNLVASAMWQRASGSIGLRYNRSSVDNRQPSRERSDFVTDVAGATLALTPSPRLSVGVEVTRDVIHNVELDRVGRNARVSLQGDWRPIGQTALNGSFAFATTNDAIATQRARNTDLRLEASEGFNLYLRPENGSQLRVFLRYARSGIALRTADVVQPNVRQWALSTGLSVRFF